MLLSSHCSPVLQYVLQIYIDKNRGQKFSNRNEKYPKVTLKMGEKCLKMFIISTINLWFNIWSFKKYEMNWYCIPSHSRSRLFLSTSGNAYLNSKLAIFGQNYVKLRATFVSINCKAKIECQKSAIWTHFGASAGSSMPEHIWPGSLD